MAHKVSWRKLVPGLIALACTLAAALAVLVFARVGALHGHTIRLYAEIDEARGILKGTPVWLDGRRIGIVQRVDFRPPDADPNRRLVMHLQVLNVYLDHIRTDSKVHIQSGGSIIGAPVIYVSEGTPASRPVHDGDTLVAQPQSDLEGAASQFAIGARQFPAIINNMKVLASALQSTRGTLGALGIEGPPPELARAESQASRLMAQFTSGEGTAGRILSGRGALMGRAQELMARVDSVRQLLGSSRTSFGRFQRDSTLIRSVSQMQRDMAALSAAARSPDGSLGRFGADSAVFQSLAEAQAAFAALIADMQRHPLRYVHF